MNLNLEIDITDVYALDPATPDNNLLLEDGVSNILLEDGSYLLQET